MKIGVKELSGRCFYLSNQDKIKQMSNIEVIDFSQVKENPSVNAVPSVQVKERTKPNRLTQKQFFKLCEELRNYREVLQTEKPSYSKASFMLRERLGFPVSRPQIQDAQEMTGITWETKKPFNLSKHRTVSRPVQNLAKAVVSLYEDFGKKVPQEVLDILQMSIKGHNG